MRPVSQSAIGLFRECPKRYWFGYLTDFEPIFFSKNAMDVGKYVHNAIEDYYRKCFVFGASQDEILYDSYNLLKQHWDTSLTTQDYIKAYTSLENHAKWKAGYKLYEQPIVEDDIYSPKWHGIVDFRCGIKAIDWKTNKYASLSYNYRMQAQIYKWIIEHRYPIKLTHFDFFFLYPNEWRTVAFNKKKQQKVAHDLINLWNAMQECYDDDEFPKQPRIRSACGGCPYRFYCQVLNY